MRTFVLLTVASVFLMGTAAHSAEPDLKTRIGKIVAAANGEEKLLKLFRIREELSVGSDPEKKGKERVSILEPPNHWWIGKRERGPEPAKFLAWAWTLGALTDPASVVESIPEITESGKTVYGLRVSGTMDPPMDLYFDKENDRLMRIDWRKDMHRLSEWQERDGVMYPAKCIGYKKSNGKPWYFSQILELEPLSELPEELTR
ncbi:hypothetical protein [Lignipirellula cremea]|nr:hypothetical protein [Lignipirellula cremea]